jgi:2'-deoxynucleoside 5'-phosphate N-hydrolase
MKNFNKEIYFACSIRGGRSDAVIYAELVHEIGKYARVLTEVFVDGKLTHMGMAKPEPEIWQTDTDWIRKANGVIAEVTNPSLGVGYEIALAESLGKPVLALYRPQPTKKLSAMIRGSNKTQTVDYTNIPDVRPHLINFIDQL